MKTTTSATAVQATTSPMSERREVLDPRSGAQAQHPGLRRTEGSYPPVCTPDRPGAASLLNGLELPLILAAAEPTSSIYRSVNSYPNLVATGIPGSPEAASDTELADNARRVLDELYAAELLAIRDLYALRSSQRRASTDIADVGRAATYGLVDTVLVDIDNGHLRKPR